MCQGHWPKRTLEHPILDNEATQNVFHSGGTNFKFKLWELFYILGNMLISFLDEC